MFASLTVLVFGTISQRVRKIRKVWQGKSIIERRKDLAMRNQRSFSLEFKRENWRTFFVNSEPSVLVSWQE